MRHISLVAFLLFSTHLTFSQGALIENEETMVGNEFDIESAGFATNSLPSKSDLGPFVPAPMEQEGGTCVGWAAAYCALSTMVNVHFDIRMPVHKELLAFDPYFIYTAMNDGEYMPCDLGLHTSMALYSLGNYGTMRDILSPDFSCDFLWTDPITGNLVSGAMVNFYAANPFKGFEYGYFKVKKNGKWLDQMKLALSNNSPVVISTRVGDSFANESDGGSISENGLWEEGFFDGEERSGHAMCAIGFDDNQHGGALKIRNSWGAEFGDNGDFWIRYEDFPNICRWAFPVYPQGDYWSEFHDDKADEIWFELQPTGSPELDYTRIEGEGGVYEGFVSKTGNAVTGIELYDDGSGYFGLFSDTKRHGIGMYVAADGTKSKCAFNNGVQIECAEKFEPQNEFERIVWGKVARLSNYTSAIPRVDYND